MIRRPEKGTLGSFTRGGDLWLHQVRLLMNSVLTITIISVCVGIFAGGTYFYYSSNETERYALSRHWAGKLREEFALTKAKMELHINSKPQKIAVQQVIQLTEEEANEAKRHLYNSTVISCLTAIGILALLSMYWWYYGSGKMTDTRLRGASLLSGENLTNLIQERDDASPYMLAGVPLRKNSENLHTLIAGAQGTGKSQQFFVLMRQVRARGKRAIVYDPSGEFAREFYREGKDILMNPLDARSPNWTIWSEIEKDYHFDTMANGLIPDPIEADPFWAKAGRMVLKDVYKVLGKQGKRTNRDLYQAIAKSNLSEMHDLLKGEAGATYVDPITERTGMSLKMTVQNQLEAFRFLHDEGQPFSIRKWIQDESDSWMFITAREELRDAMSPVLSLWIDTAMKAVLSLDPIHKERLWFFIDELPTLRKLDILKMVLTNTRKYGLCCALGVQDFSQVYEIYGHDLAKTIISGCQTKLLLRVTDGAAAKLMSELMGEAEVDEKEESLSYGLSASRDGVSVFAKRNLREIVLSSEILRLPDMHGYLVIPGDYPIGRVAYEYVPSQGMAESFIERKGFTVSFEEKSRASIAVGEVTADSNKVVIREQATQGNPLADAL